MDEKPTTATYKFHSYTLGTHKSGVRTLTYMSFIYTEDKSRITLDVVCPYCGNNNYININGMMAIEKFSSGQLINTPGCSNCNKKYKLIGRKPHF